MIPIILLIILCVSISVWLMLVSVTNKNVTINQICINIGLWMLGFYLGISVCLLMKYI